MLTADAEAKAVRDWAQLLMFSRNGLIPSAILQGKESRSRIEPSLLTNAMRRFVPPMSMAITAQEAAAGKDCASGCMNWNPCNNVLLKWM
jgi:hypothetical protein